MFVCQNQLLASLTGCKSSKKRSNVLKMALGHGSKYHLFSWAGVGSKSAGGNAIGKDFEAFLKRLCKRLKSEQVLEQFSVKDLSATQKYTIIAVRKPSQLASHLFFYNFYYYDRKNFYKIAVQNIASNQT